MKPHFTRWPVVEGFPDRLSYRSGDVVAVRCSSRAPGFSAEVARIGRERTVLWRGEGIEGAEHPITDDAYAVGCDWPVAFSFAVDPAWPSGFYEIDLIADGAAGERARSQAFFVVRPDPAAVSPAILVLATNTYNAYNQWGGACLYSGATKVSFARPIERGYVRRPAAPFETDYDGRVASVEPEAEVEHVRFQQYLGEHDYPLWCASSGWHSWERRFVQWAEGQGIALDYAVSSDLEVHPEVVDGHRLMLSVGHDEYWSWGMRDRADDFVESGGSWAIFSGNTCFWQVRYEDDGRTMVCYKGQYAQDPVLGTDQGARVSTMWSLPSIGRPECLTTGLSFTRGGYARVGQATPRASGGYTVHRPEHPLFEGTGLRYGDLLGAKDVIVGYEVDGCELELVDGRPEPTHEDGTPAGFEVLGTAPARLLSITEDECEAPKALWASTDPPGDLQGVTAALCGDTSPEHLAKFSYNHAVMGTFTKGKGRVFNAGTTDWAFGLDRDPLVQQVTLNVVRQLGGVG
jgi:N,N-dimethylformamidase beta subunit-like protein